MTWKIVLFYFLKEKENSNQYMECKKNGYT